MKKGNTWYIHDIVPVNWKTSLKKLNNKMKSSGTNTRKRGINEVSAQEYWIFIGILLLCAVQGSGGVDGLYNDKQTGGILQRVKVREHMSYSRFKFIKMHWMTQFKIELSEEEKGKKQMVEGWLLGERIQHQEEKNNCIVSCEDTGRINVCIPSSNKQDRKSPQH